MGKQPKWHCEHCLTVVEGEPAAIQKVAGYDGQIELWFCEDCSNA